MAVSEIGLGSVTSSCWVATLLDLAFLTCQVLVSSWDLFPFGLFRFHSKRLVMSSKSLQNLEFPKHLPLEGQGSLRN